MDDLRFWLEIDTYVSITAGLLLPLNEVLVVDGLITVSARSQALCNYKILFHIVLVKL